MKKPFLPGKRKIFSRLVLDWYDEYGRHSLPWRAVEDQDPYCILAAEFMLQKTTAKQVKNVYSRFLEKFPDIKSLAGAGIDKILNEIGELGLAYRAERMKKVAQQIVNKHEGRVPEKRSDLLDLPGVGRYMANSLLCYAFGKKLPVIDVNSGRVISRVFGLLEGGRMRQKEELWELAEKLLPEKRFKQYNLGLLDLGALVCHKRAPDCVECPLNSICSYKKSENI